MNSHELLIDAGIALAAYADLGLGGLASQDAQLKQAGFATAQAARFADLFTVVLPTHHDPVSDLDVTVFKDAGGSAARAMNVPATLTPTLSHEWEREQHRPPHPVLRNPAATPLIDK